MHKTLGKHLSRRGFLAGTGAVAAGLTLAPRAGRGVEEPKLNVYNWETYIGETTLADFGKASGISVRLDVYADNEELFDRLARGNPGYDVVVPTNDYVERMIGAKLLLPIKRGMITNFKNIDAAFQDARFDPGRKYSLPYMWGTQGIGYRKSAVGSPPDSWKVLLDSDEYSGRIALLSEGVIGVALKYLGYSYNSTDPAEIKQAEELLIKQKPHVKTFAENSGQDLLLSGEVDLAMEWNGDIFQVMAEDDDLAYVVPEEGSLLWQDCLCIPTGAKHPENGHKLINFILDAEVGAAIAEFIYYATPNKAARALLGDDYNKNPAIFPTEEALARCEPRLYLGGEVERTREEALTRIFAA
jgi:spermidine/putrescine transport system substrate-binding protein